MQAAALTLPELVVTFWPGSVGRRLREAYWRPRLGHMGQNCIIDVGVTLQSPKYIYLGDHVWLDSYVQLIAGPPAPMRNVHVRPNPAYRGAAGEIHIANDVHIAPFCIVQGHGGVSIGHASSIAARSSIYSLSNHYRRGPSDVWDGTYDNVVKFSPLVPEDQQAYVQSPVVLEDAAGVGLHSALLPGATIGKFSWVGVGSVVTGVVPGGVIAGGNPLRIIKQRFDSSRE